MGEIQDNGFKVGGYAGNNCLNNNGERYHYIAFK